MAASEPDAAALRIEQLSVRFDGGAGAVHAVSDLSLTLAAGATLAVVGESGCGKSALALALLRLHGPGTHIEGRVLLDGTDLLALPPRALQALRGNRIAMVFQDPGSALNPYLRIGIQLCEVLQRHRGVRARAARAGATAMLAAMGLPDPERQLDVHPHMLSGGMRQRVMVAMALLCAPRVIVADEPTTALDATVAAQVLATMRDGQARAHSALLLVTHDLGVVAGHADTVAVMYAGRIVEQAPVTALFARPAHPYTAALLASLPSVGARSATADAPSNTAAPTPNSRQPLPTIPGSPPNPSALPPGCPFAPRCPIVTPICRATRPTLRPDPDSHRVACHHPLR